MYQVPSNLKALLSAFFYCNRIVHHEFLPQDCKINKEYCLEVLRNLRERKHPELWRDSLWILYHNNALVHTALLFQYFMMKQNTIVMLQPPYFPDMASCEFFLFPKLKEDTQRAMLFNNRWDKNKIASRAQGDTRSGISAVFFKLVVALA